MYLSPLVSEWNETANETQGGEPGGSYDDSSYFLEARNRDNSSLTAQSEGLGFRVASAVPTR